MRKTNFEASKKKRQSVDDKWKMLLKIGIITFVVLLILLSTIFIYSMYLNEIGAVIILIPVILLCSMQAMQLINAKRKESLQQLDSVTYVLLKFIGVLY